MKYFVALSNTQILNEIKDVDLEIASLTPPKPSPEWAIDHWVLTMQTKIDFEALLAKRQAKACSGA